MRHSVVLDLKKCRGCTTCVKNCPTEAIRVRNGKAIVLPNRCIDCGTCIRVCPHKAVRSVCDGFELLDKFKYTVAVPDPALYGQFQNLNDINIVLNGLLKLGFDDVYESAAAGELVAEFARERIKTGVDCQLPEISPVCPAVVRLISIRFPQLLGHIAPVVSPSELAAIIAREEAVKKTGLSPEEIGVFSIVPCSSLVTSAHSPVGLPAPVLDGAFAIRDVYLALLDPMRELDPDQLQPLSTAGIRGVSWAYAGGESISRAWDSYVAVDGIDNVIRALEDIEDGRLPGADFVELRACTQGCMGGCLTVENPFGSKMRLKHLMRELPVSRPQRTADIKLSDLRTLAQQPEYLPSLQLDPDRRRAMEKLRRLQALQRQLPGLHCGSCGAPSCHALAEDVVMGRASEDDCIFKVREKVLHMNDNIDTDEYLPAPFRRRKAPPAGSVPSDR